jgi:hypothetical protein
VGGARAFGSPPGPLYRLARSSRTTAVTWSKAHPHERDDVGRAHLGRGDHRVGLTVLNLLDERVARGEDHDADLTPSHRRELCGMSSESLSHKGRRSL